MAQSFESWWNGLGPVTKFTVVFPMLLAAMASFGLVNFKHFFFYPELALSQPWRLPTSLFFLGPFSFQFMMFLAMFVVYQDRLESEDYPLGYKGRTADHVWMLLVVIVTLLPLAWLLSIEILSFSLAMAVVWVWCKRHEDQELSFYGFAFKAAYFPWFLTLVHVLLGSAPQPDIAGIIAGHVYIVLKDVLPSTHGIAYGETPGFMYNVFPARRVGVTSIAGAQTYVPDARAGVPQGGAPHRWGRGRRLGD